MKYLKKYGSIKESTMGDLSFEDFQDILTDITDKVDGDFNFHHIEDEEDGYYVLILTLKPNYVVIDENGMEFLSKFGRIDDPLTYNDEIYINIKESIEDKNSQLESTKKNIDNMISFNKKIIDIIDEINQYIIPRLRLFSNCLEIKIGFEVDELSIEFIYLE